MIRLWFVGYSKKRSDMIFVYFNWYVQQFDTVEMIFTFESIGIEHIGIGIIVNMKSVGVLTVLLSVYVRFEVC